MEIGREDSADPTFGDDQKRNLPSCWQRGGRAWRVRKGRIGIGNWLLPQVSGTPPFERARADPPLVDSWIYADQDGSRTFLHALRRSWFNSVYLQALLAATKADCSYSLAGLLEPPSLPLHGGAYPRLLGDGKLRALQRAGGGSSLHLLPPDDDLTDPRLSYSACAGSSVAVSPSYSSLSPSSARSTSHSTPAAPLSSPGLPH